MLGTKLDLNLLITTGGGAWHKVDVYLHKGVLIFQNKQEGHFYTSRVDSPKIRRGDPTIEPQYLILSHETPRDEVVPILDSLIGEHVELHFWPIDTEKLLFEGVVGGKLEKEYFDDEAEPTEDVTEFFRYVLDGVVFKPERITQIRGNEIILNY